MEIVEWFSMTAPKVPPGCERGVSQSEWNYQETNGDN
jgi:hypothetical protein